MEREGIAPLGIVRIERGEKRKRCFCANGSQQQKKGRERATLLMEAKRDHNAPNSRFQFEFRTSELEFR